MTEERVFLLPHHNHPPATLTPQLVLKTTLPCSADEFLRLC